MLTEAKFTELLDISISLQERINKYLDTNRITISNNLSDDNIHIYTNTNKKLFKSLFKITKETDNEDIAEHNGFIWKNYSSVPKDGVLEEKDIDIIENIAKDVEDLINKIDPTLKIHILNNSISLAWYSVDEEKAIEMQKVMQKVLDQELSLNTTTFNLNYNNKCIDIFLGSN